jgi:hypothetical protein
VAENNEDDKISDEADHPEQNAWKNLEQTDEIKHGVPEIFA